MLSKNEIELCTAIIAEGDRTDGRKRVESRDLNFEFMDDYGSVICSLGNTRIFVSVSAEAVEPFPDRPSEGMLRFYAELSALNEADDKLANDEKMLNRLLEKLFRTSRSVDTEGLCIVSSKLVWSIRVDVRLIANDGNLVGCACAAVLAALLHFRRPDVTVVGDSEITIHDMESRHPVPLSIHHMPVASVFSLFEFEKAEFMIDPKLDEEEIQAGSIVIAVNPQREICLIHKAGGMAITMDLVKKLCEISYQNSNRVVKIITAVVKEDVQKRK